MLQLIYKWTMPLRCMLGNLFVKEQVMHISSHSHIKNPLKRHNLFANLFLMSVCPFFCSAFSSPYSYSQVRPLCNMNVVIVVIILVVIGSFGSWLYKSIVTVTSPSGKAPATQMKRENNCM